MEELKSIKLGPYYLIRHLARGGMAEIYLVLDERDEEFYALKMLRQRDEEDCQRFLQEVQVLMQLKHPHILPVLDSGSQNGICYYVMPYIAHGTLKERLANGPLNEREVGIVLTQVADALQFLHAAGFVHRDIKPSNLLQDETNHVWLADFGLVRAMEGGSDLTRTGYLLGTPAYMAPELEKAPASASSDIYSLGVVLYELLTGHLPFTGETLLDIYFKQVYEQPLSPSAVNPLVSSEIEQVILRALEKQPADRYASAQALAEAYQEALRVECPVSVAESHPGGEAQEALLRSPDISIRKQQRRWSVPLAGGALVALAVLTLSLVSMSAVSRSSFSLFSLNSAHALPIQQTHGFPSRTSTPSNEPTSPPDTSPTGGSAPTAPGSTPPAGATPTTPSDPSGNTPVAGATPPVSSPSPGETTPTPTPTNTPGNTPTSGGTTPTPTSTPGGSNGNGNGNGNKGGNGNGNKGGNGNGNGNKGK